MPRVLITGAAGFVGKYMVSELISHGYSVISSDIHGSMDELIDVTDQSQIEKVLADRKVDAVINLAGFSSVKKSWKNPKAAFDMNVNGSLSLLSAVKKVDPAIRVLLIGSSQQYGKVSTRTPIDEKFPMQPVNPYAMTKYTQERMAVMLSKEWGLDVVMTRSFNHYGFGQEQGFVISDFASSIAKLEKENSRLMTVERVEVYRDFTDVRDIAQAYRLLLEKGRSGNAYNVGSGKVYYIKDVLDRMVEMSHVRDIQIECRHTRESEADYVCCDNSKIVSETGWNPQHDLYDSIGDIINYWRDNI